MRRAAASAFAILLSFYCAAAQEVPKGVNYKAAPDEVNAAAKSALERALASPENFPSELFGEVTVCGPMLWKSLKPAADRALLDAKPVVSILQVPEQVTAEARGIRTDNERESFWRAFSSKYASLKGATVRKGKAAEISYYWATIPFDIEEPFYVIDTGSEKFVAHFAVKDGKPRLFWIDLVGDLRTLRQ